MSELSFDIRAPSSPTSQNPSKSWFCKIASSPCVLYTETNWFHYYTKKYLLYNKTISSTFIREKNLWFFEKMVKIFKTKNLWNVPNNWWNSVAFILLILNSWGRWGYATLTFWMFLKCREQGIANKKNSLNESCS